MMSSKLEFPDGVLITHTHIDAVGGLDDLRDFTRNLQGNINVYLRQKDLQSLEQTQPWIVKPSVFHSLFFTFMNSVFNVRAMEE
jgi:phosphoribosyl 1,2-cyclic phosphodiesterase